MEEIKINKEWYGGLIALIDKLLKEAGEQRNFPLMGELSYIKGYTESVLTQFKDKNDL